MKILVKNGNPYLAINVGYGQKCNTFFRNLIMVFCQEYNTFTNFTKKLSKVLAFISNLLYVRCYILNIHLACTKGKEAINGKKTILNHKKKIMLHQQVMSPLDNIVVFELHHGLCIFEELYNIPLPYRWKSFVDQYY